MTPARLNDHGRIQHFINRQADEPSAFKRLVCSSRRLALTSLLVLTPCLHAPGAETISLSLSPRQPDISFRNELQHAIDRGLAWLQTNQNSDGSWSTSAHPGVTGLV